MGSLEAGKKADLVVLESDPYTVDPYSIHAISVDLTISNGRIVFERKKTTGK
ncbi:MAG: amidohydrolase family protein [Halieaceae bacterium]